MEHGKNKEPGGVWTEKISRRLLAAFSRDYSKLEKITDLEGVGIVFFLVPDSTYPSPHSYHPMNIACG